MWQDNSSTRCTHARYAIVGYMDPLYVRLGNVVFIARFSFKIARQAAQYLNTGTTAPLVLGDGIRHGLV